MLNRYAVVILALVVVQTGCNISIGGFNGTPLVGSGNIVAEEAMTADFRVLDVRSSFDITIRQGDEFYVLVEADDNVMEHVVIFKEGDTLRLSLTPGEHFSLKNVTLKAEVTMPELAKLELSGACRGVIVDFESTEPIVLDLSGASSLKGDLVAANAQLDLSGACKTTLAGATKKLIINASGASKAKLSDFQVKCAVVDVSGASSVDVHATEELDASASGASSIRCSGDPSTRNTTSSGASSIKFE